MHLFLLLLICARIFLLFLLEFLLCKARASSQRWSINKKKSTFNIYKNLRWIRRRRRWKEEQKSHKKREKLHSQKFIHGIDRSTYATADECDMTAQCSTDSLSHSLSDLINEIKKIIYCLRCKSAAVAFASSASSGFLYTIFCVYRRFYFFSLFLSVPSSQQPKKKILRKIP